MSAVLWLVAVVAFMIFEAVTYQVVSIWFVIGAIGGLVASLLGAHFAVQMVVFLVISVILLICFRPIIVKKLKKTDFKTNADAAVGKKVIITKDVDNVKGTGEAKLDGLVWTVRTDSNEILHAGDVAEVKRIEGVKLIVG